MSQPTLLDSTETEKSASGYSPALKTGFQETTLRVQEMHRAIASLSFQALQWIPGLARPVRWVKSAHDVITDGIYTTIRQSGSGLLETATLVEPYIIAAATAADIVPPSRLATGLRSTLNAVVGDYLASSANPLAMTMGFYTSGHLIPLTVEGLNTYLPNPSERLCLFIHGLGCDEYSWRRGSTSVGDSTDQDYGQRLQAELGYTPLYLRYNTGLSIADNGRQLAQQLRLLVAAYPQPVRELTIIGHSMGGLVARSACYQAVAEDQPWFNLTRMVICLGSPHQGAPLEQLGHWTANALRLSPVTAPLGKIVNARSAGVKNLRYGLRVLDEPSNNPSTRPSVVLRFVGASLTQDAEHPLGQLLGDGLVPVESATVSALPGDVATVKLGGLDHMALLNHSRVYQQILQWLGS